MPTLYSLSTLLLAQSQSEDDKQTTMTTVSPSDVSRAVSDGIEHDLPWELLLVGIGATLITITIVSLRRWWKNRHDDPSPIVLFTAVARKAGLGWRDRYLLWRITKTFDLPTPIALMLSKGTLRHYGDLYLSNRASGNHRRTGRRLANIEHMLFE
jgi:hypothetical protein